MSANIVDTGKNCSRVISLVVENACVCRYFRDTDGREVDFVVTEGKKLILMVEAKWNDSEVDRGLRYLKERFKMADAWQVSGVGTKDYISREGIRVAPAIEFLKTLV